jgi:hypothetical protein
MTPIEVCIRTVVDLLVRGEYETLERMTRGQRMSADQIEGAVAEYGRTLTRPDEESWWPLVDVVPVESEPGRFHAAVPLWTCEEGRSDLSVEIWLTEFASDVYAPTLLDIRVL